MEIKNFKVKIELIKEWKSFDKEDILKQIEKEWGGFGDKQYNIHIHIEEIFEKKQKAVNDDES